MTRAAPETSGRGSGTLQARRQPGGSGTLQARRQQAGLWSRPAYRLAPIIPILVSTLLLSGCAANRTATGSGAADFPRAASATTAGAAKPAEKGRKGIAAVVDGEAIPLWEYHALLELNLENGGVTDPSPAARAAVQARTLRQLVDEALLNRYAETHGLAVAPAQVDDKVRVYRLQGGPQFGALLARLGVDESGFRRLVARNLDAQAVTAAVVDRIAAPPVRVQVLQVVAPSRKRALAVRAMIRAGADPSLIAARESSDPELRRLAGALPPLTRARGDALYGPRWDAIAFALPPGAVGGPVRLRDGWGVLVGVERQPTPPLMTRTLRVFVDGLRSRARISVNVHVP